MIHRVFGCDECRGGFKGSCFSPKGEGIHYIQFPLGELKKEQIRKIATNMVLKKKENAK